MFSYDLLDKLVDKYRGDVEGMIQDNPFLCEAMEVVIAEYYPELQDREDET